MIDMTFLLLVFFMVTSTLTQQRTKKGIRLPEASASVKPEDHDQRDVINIDENGDYFIEDKKVDEENLRAYLEKRYKMDKPPYIIYLRADKDMPAKRIAEFVEMATESNVDRIIFGVLNE